MLLFGGGGGGGYVVVVGDVVVGGNGVAADAVEVTVAVLANVAVWCAWTFVTPLFSPHEMAYSKVSNIHF